MKRKIFIVLTVLGLLHVLCAAGGFAQSYDAVYSDIVAWINHFPIPSYTVDGKTAVIAEDLPKYGFDVTWDETSRILGIRVKSGITNIRGIKTYRNQSTFLGKTFTQLSDPSYAVYVNGQWVKSYAAQSGCTFIPLENLAPLGQVFWVPESRDLKLWVDGLPIAAYKPVEVNHAEQQFAETAQNVNAYVNAKLYDDAICQLEACEKTAVYDPGYYENDYQLLYGPENPAYFKAENWTYPFESLYFSQYFPAERRRIADLWRKAVKNCPLGVVGGYTDEYGVVYIDLRNLSYKPIVAVRLLFDTYDIFGTLLRSSKDYYYWLDDVDGNMYLEPMEKERYYWTFLGSKTRLVKNIRITEVVYSDYTKWAA